MQKGGIYVILESLRFWDYKPLTVRTNLLVLKLCRRAASSQIVNSLKRLRGGATCRDLISRYLTDYFQGGFLVESFKFKHFKSRFFEIFLQVSSNYLFKVSNLNTTRGTSERTDSKIS